MGPLNQFVLDDVNLLETPEAGLINIMIAVDKTIWGRLPNGTLHQFSANNVMNIVGSLNPAGGNIDYPAADAGDVYVFTTAGTIGAPPIAVEAGEMLLTITTNAGGAGAGANFTIYQINIQYATESVAGIILIASQLKMQTNVDDLAAVTSAKLYYLLQTFGISYILTDQVRGRSVDGLTPLRIVTSQNPADAGPQSDLTVATVDSVDVVGVAASASSGLISLTTGESGSVVDGNGGLTGSINVITGNGGISTGAGNGGGSGSITIQTGNGGVSATNGGNAEYVNVTGGAGGASNLAGDGGDGGGFTFQAGTGGEAKDAFTGGTGGQVYIAAGSGGQALDANGLGGAGESANLFAGSSGQGNTGTGLAGGVNIQSGNAGAIDNGANGSQKPGGLITFLGGNGNTSPTGFPGDGGGILMIGGDGGDQIVDGGAGSIGGNGGSVRVYSGPGGEGVGESGQGGDIEFTVGSTGNTSGAGAAANDGGDILFTAANGGAAAGVAADGGNGGEIQFTPGAGGAGTGVDGAQGSVAVNGIFAINSVMDAITAGAGGGFGNAFLLTKAVSRITIVAVANDSVKLPKTRKKIGEMFMIRNDAALAADIFSNDGVDTINGAASVNLLGAGASVTIIRMTATELYVFD